MPTSITVPTFAAFGPGPHEFDTLRSTNGRLTLALIDGPDDTWFYAIVEDFAGPQDYGLVLVRFGSEPPCTPACAMVLLNALAEQ